MPLDPTQLPADLPAPTDDGAAAHLVGRRLPAVRLPLTLKESIDLLALPGGYSVIFAYPMTGQPGVDLPEGWDDGARGCTPQNCAFRDLHDDFRAIGASILAVSTQPSVYQREMVKRAYASLCRSQR